MKYLFVKLDNYYLISFILILLLFLTTNHYSYEQSLLLNQLDSKSYYLISKNSPDLIYSKEIPFHHYQRFFLPYFIGLISEFTNLEIFLIYKIFTILVLILISIIHKKIFHKLNQNFETSIILLSIVIFSPYLSRYVLSIPLMLIDLSFVLINYLIILCYITKSKWIFFLIQFSLIFRLSGIATIIGYLSSCIININKNLLKILVTIFLSLITIFLLDLFAKKLTGSEFNNVHYLGLINEFNVNKLIYLFIFIFKPIICFVPLIFLLFFYKLEKKNINFENLLFFLFTSLMIIGQPILGGEQVTGNNIFRLSSLALPYLVTYFAIIFKPRFLLKNYCYVFLIINFLYSLHPKYSIISFIIN